MPQWNREPTPTTLTEPHKRLIRLLQELGLETRSEVRVGRYSLDVLVEEVWCGFEADGARIHRGLKKQQRDAERDQWILENAHIPVLRVKAAELMEAEWDATKRRVWTFIEQHALSDRARREMGKWLVS